MSFIEAGELVRSAEQESDPSVAMRKTHEAALKCQQILKAQPTDIPALTLLGSCCLKLGLLAEATACYRRAVAVKPDQAQFHLNLGLSLLGQSLARQAEEPFRQAILLDPVNASPAHVGLANILLRRGEKSEAAAEFRNAYRCEPDGAAGKFNLARAYYHEDHLPGAVAALHETISLEPALREPYRFLAQILQQQGRFAEAEEPLRKLIELDPNDGQAYKTLATGRKMIEQDRPLVDQMRSALAGGKVSPADECALHYALGKSLADLGEYEAALKEYDGANSIAAAMMLKGRPFERTKLEKAYEHAAAVFTKEFFVTHRGLGSESEMPILIVGMMRSGTTLTEQIVSCHPDVGAGGELSFWTRDGLVGLDPSATTIDKQRLRASQQEYLELLQKLAPGKKRVTDKRNSNRYFLGQIHVAFPRAKILHCMRDPVDNALSIYMTPNSAPVEFAHVRENIVFAYQESRRLMEHYRRVLPPGTMLDVRYEEMVADREAVTRRIIEFLSLDWNDTCLRHEENQRTVSTPSLWQARQPIYSTSVKRWKKYEPWLGAFKELIEE